MANEFIIRKGYKSLASSEITGSLLITGSELAIDTAEGAQFGVAGSTFGTDSQSAAINLSSQNAGLNATFGSYSRNLIKSNNANLIEIGAYTSLISGVQIFAGSSAVDGYIRFDTKANERMRIIGNGNVGIGTNNPSNKLDVMGAISGSTYYGDGSNLTGVLTSTPTLDQVTDQGATTTNNISVGSLNATQLNLENMGNYITFYGGDETNHSITSRQLDGGTGDDIRVNAYGSFIVNLDSNNNQSTAANSSFFVGRHGGNASAISGTNLLFQIDGQTGDVLPGADSTHNLGSSALRWSVGYFDSLQITNVVTNKILKFDGSDIDDSIMSDDGSTVSVAGDMTVTGTLTAQEFHTEFVSASILYESGSTKFGDTSDDVHDFTGSINILSGSATITGPITEKLRIHNSTNGGGARIVFNDVAAGDSQDGRITYHHQDSKSQGGGASFHLTGEPDLALVIGDGSNSGRVVVKSAASDSEVDYGFHDDVNTGMVRTSADNVSLVAGGVRGVGVGATAVSLKYAGNTKLATSNTGVSITGNTVGTGTAQFSGGTGAGVNVLSIGSSAQTSYTLQDWVNDTHGSTEAYIISYGSGNAQAGNFAMKNIESGGNIFFELAAGVVPLKLESSSVTMESGVLHLGKADTASGHINAYELMTFNIDSDNDDTNRYFAWYKNGSAGSGTHLMRLTEGGKLGIGTTDPGKELHVAGAISGSAIQVVGGSITNKFYSTNAGAIAEFKPSDTRSGMQPILLYRSSVNGSANYMLANGSTTLFGLYDSGVPSDVSGMIRIIPNNNSEAPQVLIGDGGSNAASLSVGGNIKLLNNGSSYIGGGNLGIGTTSPYSTTSLHITSGSQAYGTNMVIENGWGESHKTIKFNHTSNTVAEISAYGRLTTGGSGPSLQFKMYDQTTSTLNEVARFNTSGSLGIGTGAPIAVLDVLSRNALRHAKFRAPNGEERFDFYIGGTGNASRLDMYDSDGATIGIRLQSAGTTYFNGGKVGIGTTSPARPLHVHTGSADIVARFSNASSNGSVMELVTTGDNKTLTFQTDHIYTNAASLHIGNNSGNLFLRPSSSGGVTVGHTSTPAGALDVRNQSNLGGTAGDTQTQAIFQAGNSNTSRLEIKDVRTATGTDWTSAGKRIQHKIDSTWMGYIQFSGDGNNYGMSFGTGGTNTAPGNVTEKMRIESGGDVGIGTSNPSELLHLYQTGNNAPLLVHTDDHSGIKIKGGNSHDRYISFQQANGSVGSKIGWDHSAQVLKLNGVDSFASTHLVVDVNGQVGIGTDSPNTLLHLYDGAANGATTTDLLKLQAYTGDFGATPAAIALAFKFQDSNNATNEARIRMATVNDTDYGDNDEAASNLIFSTTNGGTESDKMIITGRGDIGIGTNNPSNKLDVMGAISGSTYYGDGSNLTGITAGGTDDLDDVVERGSVTDNNITVNSLLTNTDSTYTIGTNAVRFSDGYFDNLHVKAEIANNTAAYINYRSNQGHRFYIDANNDDTSHKFQILANTTSYVAGNVLLTVEQDGKLIFGSDLDTNLYRSAANTLKTDDGLFAVGTVQTNGYFQVNSSAALLKKYVSGWTSGVQTHDILYNGWYTNTGDYTYVKAAGNSTGGHGVAFIGDNVFAVGTTDVETGAMSDSATDPITNTYFRVNSSGGTFQREGDKPTVTLHHGGSNAGTNDMLGRIEFTADYSNSPIPYARIDVDTNTSSVRADMDFVVKSTSGNMETAMKLQGGAAKPKSFFYNTLNVDGTIQMYHSSTELEISGNGAGNATIDNNTGTIAFQADGSTVNSMTIASNLITLNENVTATGNMTVAGTLTAQEFHTEFVSASIIYESGSTKFGDTSDDNHDFTGSVNIDGTLTATVKSFDIVHPTQEGKRLIYGVLEGPEHAVYVRGESKADTVILPEEWVGLVDETSITAQFTPIGKPDIYYYEGYENNTVKVGGPEEKNYFYYIQATRKDVEPLITVQ